MHAHDCEVSPCAVIKAKELVDGYKEAGYDGIVITNHFDKGIMHLWGETTVRKRKSTMDRQTIQSLKLTFDDIMHITDDGVEYWSAREL